MAARPHFEPALFEFLRDLADNNEREWFQANKQRYEAQVRGPMLRFIADFAAPLAGISGKFVADARAVGGSLFRIHRDTRFSKDKSPYKTSVAARFPYAVAKGETAPVFYLALDDGRVTLGAGVWHPQAAALGRIRAAIDGRPDAWREAIGSAAFQATCRLGGESLKKAPKGYDPGHPMIEHLRRKDFVVFSEHEEADALRADFLERYVAFCGTATPAMRFLTTALELPW